MTYLAQDQLANSAEWQARVRACAIGQAEQTYVTSSDPADQSFAYSILRYEGVPLLALYQVTASAPGLADEFAGTSDTSSITDDEVLTTVQAYWHDIATSFYNPDGSTRTVGVPMLVP
jgi:hypothetical protein